MVIQKTLKQEVIKTQNDKCAEKMQVEEPSPPPPLPAKRPSSSKEPSKSKSKTRPQKPSGDDVESRLRTFPEDERSKPFYKLLAESGFYAYGDRIRCYFCKIKVDDWQDMEDPDERHKLLSPNCPFISHRNLSMPEDEDDEYEFAKVTEVLLLKERPMHPKYATPRSRFETFAAWPKNMAQSKRAMADAGFFYTEKGDCAVCYFCDARLGSWRPEDRPWVEHARWSPRCHHVRAVMGRAFVDCVRERGVAAGVRYLERAKAAAQAPAQSSQQASPPAPRPKPLAERPCLLCGRARVEVVCAPCGHVDACAECARNLVTCPRCHARVALVRLFIV